MAEGKRVSTGAAGMVAGAVIGAAAAAAAIALSDEKNRKKAEAVLKDLQKRGNKIFKEVAQKAMELRDRGEKSLPAGKKANKKKS